MQLGEMRSDDVGWIKLVQDGVHCQIFKNIMMHVRVRNFLTS
jgi:hypothetical protein